MIQAGDDTIAAVATPLGSGGVGILRISGPKAASILANCVRGEASKLKPRYLEYGHVYEGEEIVDEVLFVFMPGPNSFTGEDVAEIHGHGGVANLARLLRIVIAKGARHAEAGEFTRRAFANRRIDLTRAEAIADIVNASSEKALRVAQGQLQGSLGRVIDELMEQTTQLAAEIEAGIDFPEDSLPPAERERQRSQAETLGKRCESLAETFGVGNVLQNGIDVVLRGPVNAGKSSLFNCLVGEERALVAEEAGTTRDYVEAQVVWEGAMVTIVDTAGIRDADSEVEDRGIAMGAKRAQRADIELFVAVASEDPGLDIVNSTQIIVRSKCDSADETVGPIVGEILTSSLSGTGIEALKQEILRRATGGVTESAEGCVVTNERQRTRLLSAAAALKIAAEGIESCAPSELVVVDLNAARQSLAEITGEEIGDEMLDALFSAFCIGK